MEFNDVRLQYEQLSAEIDSAAARVFSSGRYILGPAVESFEEEFARYCRCSSGVGVASGMDALRIALAAAGVRAGDEVLVPAVSAAATAMAVTQLHAVPIFVDVDSEDFTMDPADALEKRSSRTKAASPSSCARGSRTWSSCSSCRSSSRSRGCARRSAWSRRARTG